MTILLRQKPLPQVVRQIVQRDNGAWFDTEDMSTMFQDAAGTTPVTAVEQPVGLLLDKSQGLMLGQELVSNGDFSDGSTGWALGAGWSISGGKLTGTSASGNADGTAGGAITSKFYLVKYSIESISAGGNVSVNIGGSAGVIRNSAGLYSEVISATTTPTLVRVQSRLGSTPTVVIDNISVRELYGYHATQPITASRPTLSARKNLLVATETLATQSVTTLATKYCLSFWGTGSITLSGTSTGVLQGTSSDNRVWIEFTPTAGTLTLTVSGTVNKAQLELTS